VAYLLQPGSSVANRKFAGLGATGSPNAGAINETLYAMNLVNAAYPQIPADSPQRANARAQLSQLNIRLSRLRAGALHGLGQGDGIVSPISTLPTPPVLLPPPPPAAAYLTTAQYSDLPAIQSLPLTSTPTMLDIQQPAGPSAGNSAGVNVASNAVVSPNPLDYVSPQAAIAAGLDSQTVYNAWTQGLAQYATPDQAIAAGIPAAIVNQLWAASRSATGSAATSWLDSTTFGVKNSYLMIGAGLGALAIAMARRR